MHSDPTLVPTAGIGGDESNQAGRKRYHMIGIYVAAISTDPRDSVAREMPAERDYEEAHRWLTEKGRDRDYRFGLVYNRHGDDGYRAPRISDVIAALALPMLEKASAIKEVEVHLDGALIDREVNKIKEDFTKTLVQKVVGHPKIMRGGQVVTHPKHVDIADNIASEFFTLLRFDYESAREVYESQRRVDIVGTRHNEDLLKSYLNTLKRRRTARHTLNIV